MLNRVDEQERAYCIATAICQHLDVGWDQLQGRSRKQRTVESRQLLCYVLARAGFSIALIARLLERNPQHHPLRRKAGGAQRAAPGRGTAPGGDCPAGCRCFPGRRKY